MGMSTTTMRPSSGQSRSAWLTPQSQRLLHACGSAAADMTPQKSHPAGHRLTDLCCPVQLQEHPADYWQDADDEFWEDPASSPERGSIISAGSPAKDAAALQQHIAAATASKQPQEGSSLHGIQEPHSAVTVVVPTESAAEGPSQDAAAMPQHPAAAGQVNPRQQAAAQERGQPAGAEASEAGQQAMVRPDDAAVAAQPRDASGEEDRSQHDIAGALEPEQLAVATETDQAVAGEAGSLEQPAPVEGGDDRAVVTVRESVQRPEAEATAEGPLLTGVVQPEQDTTVDADPQPVAMQVVQPGAQALLEAPKKEQLPAQAPAFIPMQAHAGAVAGPPSRQTSSEFMAAIAGTPHLAT